MNPKLVVDGRAWVVAVDIRSCSYADSMLVQEYSRFQTGLDRPLAFAGWDTAGSLVADASQAAA